MRITDWPPYPDTKPTFDDFALSDDSDEFIRALSTLLHKPLDVVVDLIFDPSPRRSGIRTRLIRKQLSGLYLNSKLHGITNIPAELFSTLTRLGSLDVRNNEELQAIDLSNCRHLESLWLNNCSQLQILDLTGCPSVFISDEIESKYLRNDLTILCSDLTVHNNHWHNSQLRLNTYVASTNELHSYIINHPQLEPSQAVWVVDHPNCDIATAIAAYWKLRPILCLGFRSLSHARQEGASEYVTAFARIEHRVESGLLCESGITYDFAGEAIVHEDVNRISDQDVRNFRLDLPDDLLQPIGYIASIEAEIVRDRIRCWNTRGRPVGFAGMLSVDVQQ